MTADPGYNLVDQPAVPAEAFLIVSSALAWCVGYLDGIGHDVRERPFIKQAMEPVEHPPRGIA